MDENNVSNLISLIAWNIFFESDEEDESYKEDIEKNIGYYEQTIPSFDDQTFKSHFRLKRESFENLSSLFHEELGLLEILSGRPQIPLEKQTLLTLWFLSNTECFRSVADRFGICKKTCWVAVGNICRLLLKINRRNQIIEWPTSDEAQRTASFYQETTRFPGVIGCIDGTHIPIARPKESPNSYVNRKKFHSILLQVVCNEKLIFIDCYAGEAGSVHDACLFRRSNLFRNVSNGTIFIRPNQHMLGDQAYGLKPYILTPFKDHGTFTEEQRKYNELHSKIRVSVERSIGLLKGRFRRLKQLNSRKPEFNPLLTLSCCILHNFCLKNDDFLEEEEPHNFHIETFDFEDDGPNTSESNEHISQRKRSIIAHQLL